MTRYRSAAGAADKSAGAVLGHVVAQSLPYFTKNSHFFLPPVNLEPPKLALSLNIFPWATQEIIFIYRKH